MGIFKFSQPRHVGLTMFQSLKKLLQSRHIQFGVPFIGLLVGSSFALTNVTSFRYEFRKTQGLSEIDVESLKAQGVIRRDPGELSLENLYGEYMEQNEKNLENYDNLRIPRPWEDETQVDLMRKENRRIKTFKEIKEAQALKEAAANK